MTLTEFEPLDKNHGVLLIDFLDKYAKLDQYSDLATQLVTVYWIELLENHSNN